MNWKSWLYRKPERYDRMLAWLHGDTVGRRFDRVARLVGAGRTVLDLGAGTGVLAGHLLPGCRYIGADLNQKFLAHMEGRGLETVELDVFDFDAYPAGVDVVVAADLLHHLIPRVEEFLTGLGRLEIPQVIVCESYPYGARLWSRILGPVMDNDGFNNLPARIRHHLWDEFTEESLKAMMGRAFPGWRATYELLTERGEPGKERRGWDTLIASFGRPEVEAGSPAQPRSPEGLAE